MQDWNGCSSLEQDNGSNGDRISITLTDKRDGNEYTVAKLKDGKCWMTQNLRLVNTTITPADSNLSSGSYFVPSSKNGPWNSYDTSMAYLDTTNGGLYNFYTATAGYGKHESYRKSNVPYSICPKNWHLPNDDETTNLIRNYSAVDKIVAMPANFTKGNNIYDHQGYNIGAYWEQYSTHNGSHLIIVDSSVTTSNYSKYCGSHVRCISN